MVHQTSPLLLVWGWFLQEIFQKQRKDGGCHIGYLVTVIAYALWCFWCYTILLLCDVLYQLLVVVWGTDRTQWRQIEHQTFYNQIDTVRACQDLLFTPGREIAHFAIILRVPAYGLLYPMLDPYQRIFATQTLRVLCFVHIYFSGQCLIFMLVYMIWPWQQQD